MYARLMGALDGLGSALAGLAFEVPGPERDELRARRDRLIAEIAGHAARLRDWQAPMLVVLAGGTGAGKSTLANSLVGQAVAATGVVRPTTASPTLVVDPRDAEWFSSDRVLPGLARVHGHSPDGTTPGRLLHIVDSRALPRGLALIDAPDVDSVRTDNRDLAELLLDAADVWVWLVTARTYADEEAMRYLRRAARRRTALAVVLTQVHERDIAEIRADLDRKLAAEGLADVERFVVPLARVEAQRLPGRTVAPVRDWLRSLADPNTRERLRRQTLDGAMDDLPHEVGPLVAGAQDELAVLRGLEASAQLAFARVPARFGDALDEGLPLRQEILARWSDFVGASRFLAFVETATGMVRGWVRDTFATVASAEQERIQRRVRSEVAGTLGERIVEVCDLAAADVVADWERLVAGQALVAERAELRRSDPSLPERAEHALLAWQATVEELIRTKGVERRIRARWLSTAVNAAATAAILLTFASTGGLTGVEAGIAATASAANQTLLVKVLGAQNLNWLMQRVRADLLERVAALAQQERDRYHEAVAEFGVDPDAVARVEAAFEAVEQARR